MVKFTKMTASGNDFVIIDNRTGGLAKTGSALANFVKKVCERKMGPGADGVLLVEESSAADFRMRVFNPDGGEAEMCGNGARCITLWATLNIKGQKSKVKFETMAGILEAEVTLDKRVSVKMSDPTNIRLNHIILLNSSEHEIHSINTGVPHAVLFIDDMMGTDIKKLGSKIRHYREFAPAGTNVDFIRLKSEDSLYIRTYERGVEGETLACGTGACAAAIVSHLLGKTKVPTKMYTKSGSILRIYFDVSDDSRVTNLYLEGDAAVVYEGELS
jgi:diaminopimelate epimerase